MASSAVSGDLTTRAEIHDLVVGFYREIIFDDLLGPVFDEVAEVDWTLHLPKLVDYWCRVLLGQHGYVGNVTAVHRHLHGLEPVTTEHCDRWYELWVRCVDARWGGATAEHATAHAAALMTGMARRIFDLDWAPPVC
jgi:hemoglobin